MWSLLTINKIFVPVAQRSAKFYSYKFAKTILVKMAIQEFPTTLNPYYGAAQL
jgi:hypothetical protein